MSKCLRCGVPEHSHRPPLDYADRLWVEGCPEFAAPAPWWMRLLRRFIR